MPIRAGNTAVTDIRAGTVQVNKVYAGLNHDPVWSRPGIVHATISNFGARVGSNPKQPRLTVNRDTDLPESVTISATLANQTGWTLTRTIPSTGASQQVAAGFGTVPMSYIENLSSQFAPPAAGWTYTLTANAASAGGEAHASIVVRSIAAPTLTSFTVDLENLGGTQFAFLNWTATPGDPAATWTMTQSGPTVVDDLPSSRHLTPAAGQATGTNRVRVSVSGPGGTTTLTLAGVNEAGTVNRSVTINWT